MKEIVSFLGPKGTFSHEAASILGHDLVPFCTIPAVMESVESGQCAKGIVPIENSIEGPVGITLDSLAHEEVKLKILKMFILINKLFLNVKVLLVNIAFNLITRSVQPVPQKVLWEINLKQQ